MINFIHNPKTGGRAIYDSFKGKINYMGHAYDSHTAEPTYMVFRNPYERLRSAYDWVIGGGNGSRRDIEEKNLLLSVGRKSLDLLLFPHNYNKLIHFIPQCRYISQNCTLIPYSNDIVSRFSEVTGLTPTKDTEERYNTVEKSFQGEWYTHDDIRYLVDRVYYEDFKIWLELTKQYG